MTKLPRKMTITGAGIAGLLVILKFDVSMVSYFVCIGIVLMVALSVTLQAVFDIRNGEGEPNGNENQDNSKA